MSDTLQHLQKLKNRLSQTLVKSQEMSAVEKVDQLEQALSIFRTEVDMKLQIMQQILTTRSEQVAVQKKLLDKEQTLYNTLLGHWINTPQLAATGLSVNFSAANVNVSQKKNDKVEGEGVEDNGIIAENQSDLDYSEGDDISFSPTRKKSRSSLRKQRQSGRSARNSNVKNEQASVDPYQDPHVEVEIGTTEDGGAADVDDDFSDFLGDLSASGAADQDRDGEEDMDTSGFHDSVYPSNNPSDITFASVETRDGRKLELKLPQSLIYQLQSAPKERSIVMQVLRHYYPIHHLLKCTLTGASKGCRTNKHKALPPDMIILIQEAVRKYLPPTKTQDSEEGRKLIAEQKMRVRNIITSLLQYFRDFYNEDGTPRKSRSKAKKRRAKLDLDVSNVTV